MLALFDTNVYIGELTRAIPNAASILSQWHFSSGENEVLFKLQNDVLIALTARSLGAVVITQDKHFEKIAEKTSFLYFLYR